jgi:molybdenum cofactor cytidylyltransferase
MICAVVLAAGRSERMGPQKLLLPLRGRPVIAGIVDELIRSPVQQVIVVVGRDAEPIKLALSLPAERGVHAASRPETRSAVGPSGDVPPLPVRESPTGTGGSPVPTTTFVSNPDPDGDMLSSVRCGLRALPASCEAVLVVLGDQPGVTRKLVGDLIRAFRAQPPESGTPNRKIIVPTHAGRRGHPLLFAARYRDEILTRYDGVGLHGLLAAHPEVVAELEVFTAVELADMDTPEDYQRQLANTTNTSA